MSERKLVEEVPPDEEIDEREQVEEDEYYPDEWEELYGEEPKRELRHFKMDKLRVRRK